jgi:hypothetical protein
VKDLALPDLAVLVRRASGATKFAAPAATSATAPTAARAEAAEGRSNAPTSVAAPDLAGDAAGGPAIGGTRLEDATTPATPS